MIQQLDAVPLWDRDMIVSVGSMMKVSENEFDIQKASAEKLCENVNKVLSTYDAIVRLKPAVDWWEDPKTKEIYISVYARLTKGCAKSLAEAENWWYGVEIPGRFKFLLKPEGAPFVEILP